MLVATSSNPDEERNLTHKMQRNEDGLVVLSLAKEEDLCSM